MINYALTTKERVKARLQITTTSFDDMFDSLIAATTNKIEQMTGRRFKATTYADELYDGSDVYGTRQEIIVVNNAPMLTLTRFQYKNGNNENPAWTDFTEDDYDINESNGIIRMKGYLPGGMQNVRISYQAGYLINFSSTSTVYDTAQHTLPYDITEVCEEAVVRLYKRRDSEGRSSESFQESSITWNENIFTKENITTINNYRRVTPW